MEAFYKVLCELFVLFLEGLQVSPVIRIQKIKKIKQFPDVVIQRRLRT